MGYPDLCIALPPGATDDEIDALCVEHTAKLQDWIDKRAAESDDDGAPGITRYDGTMLSACRIYQEHPRSRFHRVKGNTRKSYLDSLKIVESEVGRRLIRNVTTFDMEHWYEEWRKGVVFVDEDGKRTIGPERIDRAHDAISMVKTVIYFNARFPTRKDCKRLAEELTKVKFERGGAREQEMTYAHVLAFIRTALEQGERGVIPRDRARYMALGVAAQFELMLRQKDIIGEWQPLKGDMRFPIGQLQLELEDEIWSGYFTWENIPGWRWRLKTSKSKYRAPAEFDLTNYPLLFPLLEAVPQDQRTGAIVKGEHGLPIRERSYRKWFRPIARAAKIPDDVWLMDSRAGGATEAEESGAELEAIQGALTHSRKETTLRYIRRRSKKIADVAAARSAKRTADEGSS